MAVSNRLKNQHLLWRTAFGPMAENAASLDTMPQKSLWALLVKTSAKPVQKIKVTNNPADEYMMGMTDPREIQKAMNNPEMRKKIREQSKEDLRIMNIRWLETMVNSEAQLREKMSLFWHGHFACRTQNSFFAPGTLTYYQNKCIGQFCRNAEGSEQISSHAAVFK